MAPEIAVDEVAQLKGAATVLDPMSGSGTVIREAVARGHTAIGFDLDPLAVLMGAVATRRVDPNELETAADTLLAAAERLDSKRISLPWIDDDDETRQFISYWFGEPQIDELRRLAFLLNCSGRYGLRVFARQIIDAMKLGLSRTIITKEQCASLARDTSHSRPHKVASTSDYSVFQGFRRSVSQLASRLETVAPKGKAVVAIGDARKVKLSEKSVDLVVTSPPYLNAIDYMRGHRLSLVWLGYKISSLRRIRSSSIGAERSPDLSPSNPPHSAAHFAQNPGFPSRYRRMVDRYLLDIDGITREIARVLKRGGKATLVVGNSCLAGTFIRNADFVREAAERAGLHLLENSERELPARNRYLPIGRDGALAKRMRTESVLKFVATR